MAGRESSGNPSGGQAGREERSLDSARDDKRIAGGVKPVSPKERRKWERVGEKKNEELRSKYRAVHGKVVDWVDHVIEDGYLFVSIRFKDKTDFCLLFSPKIVTDEIALCDVRTGNFRVLRQYFRRRGD